MFVYGGDVPVPALRVSVGLVKGGIVGANEVEFLKNVSSNLL